MVLFELCLLLLEIFDVVVIGECLAGHEVDSFLSITELADSFDTNFRVTNGKDTIRCDAGGKR